MISAFLIWAAMAFGIDSGGQPPLPIEPLSVQTAGGALRHFKVEMATTEDAMRIGMMFRRKAPPGTGMLFDYGTERQGVAFWMKNTLIPLDMIFIDGKGRIVSIKTAQPLDETPVPAGAPTRAVLEVAGGEAARLNIKPGDRVRHRIFGDVLRPH